MITSLMAASVARRIFRERRATGHSQSGPILAPVARMVKGVKSAVSGARDGVADVAEGMPRRPE
ncbi:MAG: hypothetical protein DRG76_11725 [Deltaproteobacteria bacterium]|nr:MAG: hypothetical protein DRG76_11725 [Deltaproteobacteria bacterium]